jgi:hypothetical protein
VSAANGAQRRPQTSGPLIVWEDGRNNATTGWDIYGRNILTGREFVIAAGVGDERAPVISGPRVVWQQHSTNGDWDLYTALISNDVAGAATALITDAGDQQDAALDGDLLVWETAAPGISPCTGPVGIDGLDL